ncbi:UNVERIFIED_ORG: helix-turn-helix transcriptional regulator [Roseateles sp. XES5]|nr:helix-turn-helix transcriptional regulator [Roseateles sp. XES5]
MKPRTPLAARLIEVRETLGFKDNRNGFAERLDLVPDTLGSYERGVAAPPPDVLARYHKEFGVNISWLVSGEGVSLDDPSKAQPPRAGVDIVLLQRLHDAVQAVYIECKRTPPPRAVTAGAGELYNELLGMVADVRDQAVVSALLPVLRDRFKERISKAEPGSSKAVGS